MNSIHTLDQATTEVAGRVFQCVPFKDWISATCTVRIAPHGNAKSINFAFQLPDGRIDKGASPVADAEQWLDDALDAHWKLAKMADEAPWFQMKVTVERSGKYSVDLAYKDDYKEGDIFKPLE